MTLNVGRILRTTSLAALMIAMAVWSTGCTNTILQSNPVSLVMEVGDVSNPLAISYYTSSTNTVTVVTDATFASDNEAVATVGASTGVVTAVAIGATNITVTGNGLTVKVPVLVGPVSHFTISGNVSGLPTGCMVQINNSATSEILGINGVDASIAALPYAFVNGMVDATAFIIAVANQPATNLTCTSAPTCGISVSADTVAAEAAAQDEANGVGIATGTIDAANIGNVTGINVRCATEIDTDATGNALSVNSGATAALNVTSLPGVSSLMQTITPLPVPFADLSAAGSWTTDNSIAVASGAAASTPSTYIITGNPTGYATTTLAITDDVTGLSATTVNVTVLSTVTATVAGSSGPLTLQNNGADDLAVTADGDWKFATGLGNAGAYDVTVSEYPDNQDCHVTSGSGTNTSNLNVSGIEVSCGDETLAANGTVTTTMTVGGSDQTLHVDETISSTVAGGWTQAITTLNNANVSFTSADTAKCTVGLHTGVVHAVAAGTCSITAEYHGGTMTFVDITIQ